MKATADLSFNNRHGSKTTENKVGKSSRRERDVIQDEMQQLLTKLKELVPNMPRNKRLSKLEIIQHVIDYIVDLQIALETHPATRPANSGNNPGRQPLGVLSPSSNPLVNPCAAQEATHTEKTPSNLSDLVVGQTRPVSC
ncbi:DNA-binding protein inhibitor ID-2-like [Limulus polyphemus]|uniref:DNA-binding protein inhibitor ID-2-like n=1 Tax=Limulus polyphemus TaxID=6850 RepID=A0ABM1BKQ6_LIMPO|nr:DNA-binding protein inhibitor ID-2-like [Limulus polyphemus]